MKGSEGRAVNGVNNDWHLRAGSGKPSQHTRLSAVSVNYVRSSRAKHFCELHQGSPVLPGMDGPYQMGQEG